jgi:ADP-heptose:LPS heptosyltransferase
MKILLIKLDAIGDFVLFTSVLPHIRQLYKHAHLTLLVQEQVRSFADVSPYVDEVLSIDLASFHSRKSYQREILEHIRVRQFDMMINAMYTRTIDSDEVVAYVRSYIRIGFQSLDKDGNERIRTINESLYTHLIPTDQEWKHELERYKVLLNYLGYSSQPLVPELWITQHDIDRCIELLGEIGLNQDDRFVTIFPGAGLEMRHWQAEKFAAVADKLIEEHNVAILVVGGYRDRDIASKVIQKMQNPCRSLVERTTLRELAAVLWLSSMYLGNETSGMHIAATIGTPLVALYGGGHWSRFNPVEKGALLVYNTMDCYYCHWICKYGDFRCIKDITVEQVFAAAEEMLRTTDSRRRIDPVRFVPTTSDPIQDNSHSLERTITLWHEANQLYSTHQSLNLAERLRISSKEYVKRKLKSYIYRNRDILQVQAEPYIPYREVQGLFQDGWSGEVVRILFSAHYSFEKLIYQFHIPDVCTLLPLELTMKLNGTSIVEAHYDKSGDYQLEAAVVRQDLFALHDLNEILILANGYFIPKKLGGSNDERRLVLRPSRLLGWNRLGMRFTYFSYYGDKLSHE